MLRCRLLYLPDLQYIGRPVVGAYNGFHLSLSIRDGPCVRLPAAPNGLELSCPAGAGTTRLIVRHAGGPGKLQYRPSPPGQLQRVVRRPASTDQSSPPASPAGGGASSRSLDSCRHTAPCRDRESEHRMTRMSPRGECCMRRCRGLVREPLSLVRRNSDKGAWGQEEGRILNSLSCLLGKTVVVCHVSKLDLARRLVAAWNLYQDSEVALELGEVVEVSH